MALKRTLHLIEEDLENEDWAIFFVTRLEQYLENYQRFVERYGA